MKPSLAPAPFMFDRAAETMPRRELAALQVARLKETLARAYESVAPIRRKFDAAGVTLAHLACLADLAHFPFTLKTDLRDRAAMTATRWHAARAPGVAGWVGQREQATKWSARRMSRSRSAH